MQTTLAKNQPAQLKDIPEWERRARLGSKHLMEAQMQRAKDGGAVEECLFDDAPPAIDSKGQVALF